MTDDELHAKITAWHEAPSDSPEAKMQLHEHLDWTWEQYKNWVREGIMPT